MQSQSEIAWWPCTLIKLREKLETSNSKCSDNLKLCGLFIKKCQVEGT